MPLTDEKKVKTTKTHLGVFKHEFLKYQKLLGLNGWDVSFSKKTLNSVAQICYVTNDCNAEVVLGATFPRGTNIKKTAKHEAIHLLLARYDYLATARYVNPEELIQANEEITVKLTDIIP